MFTNVYQEAGKHNFTFFSKKANILFSMIFKHEVCSSLYHDHISISQVLLELYNLITLWVYQILCKF